MARIRSGPAHGRRLSKPTENRLRMLGDDVPPPVEPIPSDRRGVPHLRRYLVVMVVLVIAVLAAVQWFRPLPSPQFRSSISTSLSLPGKAASFPWPTAGSAAMSVVGGGSLGQVGGSQPVPIASIAKVLTAYIVLKDHPLASGASGPVIAVTADTVSAYQSGLATQQSEVPVAPGESLTELQALEGLLVASGNDMATFLADWDAGSTTSFVAKMTSTAQALGLGSTHITDPSGFDDTTVSNSSDLIKLGQAAMTIPAFSQIAAMGEVTLPMAGLVYNFDYLLGHDGFVGIKTGSDSAAGGCFLFEAQRTVGGKSVAIIGVVLGQGGTSPVSTALEIADLLVDEAFTSIKSVPLVAPGKVVGRIVDRWGSSAPVTVPDAPIVTGWPGTKIPVHVRAVALPSSAASGTQTAVLSFDSGGREVQAALRTSRPLPGPSVLWRLTRL